MNNRREKVIQILIASFITIVVSYAFFLTTNTSAKEIDNPGQRIKQIVHHYNELRKTEDLSRQEIKELAKEQKEEILAEVKGTSDENSDVNSDNSNTDHPTPIPPSPLPSAIPTIKLPIIDPPRIDPSPTSTPKITQPQDPPTQDACIQSGGTWRDFPNSCGDSCALTEYPGQIMCAQVITQACDCGPSACWNGNSCVNNPSVKGKTLPTPTIKVPPPIDEYVCGNGICEPGESGSFDCPVCDTPNKPCPLRACIHEPGSCPQDCSIKPIDPAI